jgi:dTDP-4-amino-4,6-dideoxygalactose transaminase
MDPPPSPSRPRPPRKLGTFLRFAPPLLDREELLELKDTLDSGWLTRGPKCERFEEACLRELQAESTLALSSCTEALHLGLRALGVGEGDAVVTTPLTFVSTAHAVIHAGARPLFCDIDPADGNLSPALVREFLDAACAPGPDGSRIHRETGLRVGAVLPVHYGGFPADVEGFRGIASECRLHVLEDAAHAFGSLAGGRPVGSRALLRSPGPGLHALAAFSFYATKNVACGEGGLLAGPETVLAKARILSAYGISDARRIWGRYAPRGTWAYDVEELGFKANFTDLGAALGLAQLRRFPEMQERRRRFAAIWSGALSGLAGDLVTLPEEIPGTRSAWHLYPLRLRAGRLAGGRDKAIERLRELNIGASVMFQPVHLFTYYRRALGHREGDFPQTEAFSASEISLPMSPANPVPLVEEAAETLRRLLLDMAG